MKVIITIFICVVMTSQCSADADSCQSWQLVCNHRAPSYPTDPAVPVKRGKMGARGEKGQKGENGQKGPDLSHEVEENENKIFNANKKVENLEVELKRQKDTISEFKYFLSVMNDTVRNQFEKIEQLQTTFLKKEGKFY